MDFLYRYWHNSAGVARLRWQAFLERYTSRRGKEGGAGGRDYLAEGVWAKGMGNDWSELVAWSCPLPGRKKLP